MALFPETNPLLDELKELDVNSLSPIEALNKIFEWQREVCRKGLTTDFLTDYTDLDQYPPEHELTSETVRSKRRS